jgi:glycosyltransferase involved in cell wall biosynthesis
VIRVLAHVYAYNEADILPAVVEHLIAQGVDVWVTDNWSTDRTYQIARALQRKYRPYVFVMRWPEDGPTDVVSWHAMLRRLERVARIARTVGVELGTRPGPYDWVIHHDADEIRRSAVPGETLHGAITRLDAAGYTALDHEVQVFRPREGWDGTQDPETWFTERVADQMDMHNPQIKCWKQPATPVDLASMGGHAAQFPGRRVAPEKLILKHYPLRTAAQAARKIASRKARWAPEDRQAGWHVQHQRSELVKYGLEDLA